MAEKLYFSLEVVTVIKILVGSTGSAILVGTVGGVGPSNVLHPSPE